MNLRCADPPKGSTRRDAAIDDELDVQLGTNDTIRTHARDLIRRLPTSGGFRDPAIYRYFGCDEDDANNNLEDDEDGDDPCADDGVNCDAGDPWAANPEVAPTDDQDPPPPDSEGGVSDGATVTTVPTTATTVDATTDTTQDTAPTTKATTATTITQPTAAHPSNANGPFPTVSAGGDSSNYPTQGCFVDPNGVFPRGDALVAVNDLCGDGFTLDPGSNPLLRGSSNDAVADIMWASNQAGCATEQTLTVSGGDCTDTFFAPITDTCEYNILFLCLRRWCK